MRRITLDIAPATETTCSDGSRFCPYAMTRELGTRIHCGVFADELRNEHGAPSGPGWLQRLPACRAAELVDAVPLGPPFGFRATPGMFGTEPEGGG